ncbi:MAG TPA: hypothetical protein PLS50_05990 [Candidatus Dojkabacteria bacterium]|nr:hypothetical protein [Candidatus Dojkabacteria bacterium]
MPYDLEDSQTFIISINCSTFNTNGDVSQVTLPMNLRFAADMLVLKSIAYNARHGNQADENDMVQIWCNITNDQIIGSFPNAGTSNIPVSTYLNSHYRLNNSFQTGNLVFQLQQTDGAGTASYNPQALISLQNQQRTFGVVTLTIEFVKLKKIRFVL